MKVGDNMKSNKLTVFKWIFLIVLPVLYAIYYIEWESRIGESVFELGYEINYYELLFIISAAFVIFVCAFYLTARSLIKKQRDKYIIIGILALLMICCILIGKTDLPFNYYSALLFYGHSFRNAMFTLMILVAFIRIGERR